MGVGWVMFALAAGVSAGEGSVEIPDEAIVAAYGAAAGQNVLAAVNGGVFSGIGRCARMGSGTGRGTRFRRWTGIR